MIYLFCLGIGALAGLLSGLFGIGGGILLVPLLNVILLKQNLPPEHIMHFAIGTSLGTMIFSTLSATVFQQKRKAVQWPLFIAIAPGTILGGFLGVAIGDAISKEVLRGCFSLFCLVIAYLFLKKEKYQLQPNQAISFPKIVLTGMGLLVGTIASMVGIGGGIILVPLLVRLHLSMPQAIALSVSCAFPTVLAGTTSAIIFGWDAPAISLPHLGYVIWPMVFIQGVASIFMAKVGVHLAHRIPRFWLRKILATLLLFIAWLMLPL